MQLGDTLLIESNRKISIAQIEESLDANGSATNPNLQWSAGSHSLWQNIRVFDGTQSHLLEEVLDYSCYTSQLFLATKCMGWRDD